MFTISCWYGNYYAALISRMIFGIGQGSAVVAQGRLAAHWFVGKELVFAIALTEASHDVAQWIAKVYPVPITHLFHTWIAPLWIGCILCAISIACALIYFYSVQALIPHHTVTMDEHGEVHTDQEEEEDNETSPPLTLITQQRGLLSNQEESHADADALQQAAGAEYGYVHML